MVSLSEPRIALITGITGFTGRYVADRLARDGYEVHGWSHTSMGASGVTAVDIVDRQAVIDAVSALQPDVVVHLAAITFVAHGDADAIYRSNVVGTRNLLEALAQRPLRASHVLLASSANVYGNVGGVIDEDAPPSPPNDYAVSKLAMEYMAALWKGTLPITLIRPFNYTGVGQSAKFVLPKIVSHFQRRMPLLELGNIDVSRDFYDVRCVAEAIGRLVATGNAQGTYNICSGEEHSLREVLSIMERISGHSLEVRVNPDFVRSNEIKSLRGDNRRLLGKIGRLPAFSLEDTLRWMYENPIG